MLPDFSLHREIRHRFVFELPDFMEITIIRQVVVFGMPDYQNFPGIRKGQNIGTLKKREQGSMLLSSNYRRNSTYVANIG